MHRSAQSKGILGKNGRKRMKKMTVAAWVVWALVVLALLATPAWNYASEALDWYQPPASGD